MEFDAVLIAARREPMIRQGLWHDTTINDYLDACLAECPEKTALIAFSVESQSTTSFTYAELARMVDRVALGLAKLGIARFDVVSCQLPNWWQLTVMYLAASRDNGDW